VTSPHDSAPEPEPTPEPAPELGEIEWLDGEPPDRPRGPRPPWRGWYLLVLAAIVAVVLALTVGRQSSKKAAPKPTSTPTTTRPSLTPTRSPVADPTTSAPAVTVTAVGHPLLPVAPGLELFAYGAGSMLRLQLAAGRITRTDRLDVDNNTVASFVVGPHEAFVKPWGTGVGYIVRDGLPAQPLAGPLNGTGLLLPGPEPTQVWVSDGDGTTDKIALVGVDGRPTGITIPGIPGASSDGAGYLVASLAGGTYEVRPGSVQRITSGALLAIGPTHWLTEECDDQHRCTRDVIERGTGEHHVLGPISDSNDPQGQISPDGSTAAVLRTRVNGSDAELHLLDLSSGADRKTDVLAGRDQSYNGATLAWTPDSRWLFVVDSLGRIIVVDRAGHSRVLTRGDPSISMLALRG
jgi:hypothetical protein